MESFLLDILDAIAERLELDRAVTEADLRSGVMDTVGAEG